MNKIKFADSEVLGLKLKDVSVGAYIKFYNDDSIYILSTLISDDDDCMLVDINTGDYIYSSSDIIPECIYNADIILTRRH